MNPTHMNTLSNKAQQPLAVSQSVDNVSLLPVQVDSLTSLLVDRLSVSATPVSIISIIVRVAILGLLISGLILILIIS